MPDTATKAPDRELGAQLQSTPFGPPILDERETANDWRWPRSVTHTVPAMLNDAQLDGLSRGTTLPIREYDWRIDPNGARPEIVDALQADIALDLVGQDPQPLARTARRFVFDRHLEDALRAPVGYGHYFFEQVAELRQDGNPAVNAGWLAHLRKLAPRPPGTITEIRVARDGGLDFIRVPSLNGDQTGGGLTAMGGIELDVDRVVAYVWDKEGPNWRGRSMLRSSYRPWKLKDRVLRVGAINIERAGGVPYVKAPQDATPKQMDELTLLATKFRVGENSGAALPYGADLAFARSAGGDEAINYVRLMNEEMAGAWLQMVKQLGQTQTGSRALGETFVDMARVAQHAIAGWFCDTFNEHVIEDWVEWNYGPDEKFAPRLVFHDSNTDPVAGIAIAIDQAQSAGALPPGSPVAAAVTGAPRSRRPARAATSAPAVGHRQPTPIEEAAGVDFARLDAHHASALADALAAFADVQASQIDELVAQVEAMSGAQDIASLTATPAGADRLTEILHDIAAKGAATARDEATSQGHALPAAALGDVQSALEGHATAIEATLATALTQAAAARCLQLVGGTLTAADMAGLVRDHLEGLSGAFLEQRLGGVVTTAQNQGRFAQMREWGDSADFYSSELLDQNTCEPCASEDGTDYGSMDDAQAEYPAGYFVGCEGGDRCRGTLVAVAKEDT